MNLPAVNLAAATDDGSVARRTLVHPTSLLTGIGIHGGETGGVQFLPAPAGTGLVFQSVRTGQEIAVHPSNRHSTTRCTAISAGGEVFFTVEHVLSALNGCGVTDAVIAFEGPEAPILDGSAAPFVAEIVKAGLTDLDARIEPIRLMSPLTVQGDGASMITAAPSDHFWINVVVDYPGKPLMTPQAASYQGVDYAVGVAPARTYGFVAELKLLAERGLAKGASRENAFALREDGTPDESTPLRFANEAARHKLLDLIGDLAFAGRPIRAGIVAVQPGHGLNMRLAAELSGLIA
ncbi:MAG: UDP-3-O-acyl-N-acetylglucosamine deacetylase [Capsulimonadaceae bacterium]|nr:UDP-3-O-acyl-N-acetylglucosamine deacetylase [Capsulimonadaceae bacterium]